MLVGARCVDAAFGADLTGQRGYRISGEGFGFYSVGLDGHDDGGRPAARISPLLGPERAWEGATGDDVLGVTQ